MAEKPAEAAAAATAPDPDEDDLDDLDDVLDSFQDTKISEHPASSTATATTTSALTASGPGRPPAPPRITHDAPSDQDFAAQLQAGMGNLIAELDANPDMQAEFEKMMQELIAAGAAGTDQEAGEHLRAAAEAAPKSPEVEAKSPPATASKSSKKSAKSAKKASASTDPDAFQSTIKKTMERMQASDSTAKASTSSAMSEEDLLAQMMKELTGGGSGADSEEGFNAMLMNMMAHLTNKEILYEPMKELHDKYPAWLETNAAKQKKEDLDRYKEQQRLVGEIVGRFETKGYSDENEDDREYIVERMQKMQAAGSPPSDLVGDMSAAQEALAGMDDEGCPTQ